MSISNRDGTPGSAYFNPHHIAHRGSVFGGGGACCPTGASKRRTARRPESLPRTIIRSPSTAHGAVLANGTALPGPTVVNTHAETPSLHAHTWPALYSLAPVSGRASAGRNSFHASRSLSSGRTGRK